MFLVYQEGAATNALSKELGRMRRYTIINQRVETRFEAHRVAEVKRRFLQLNGCMCIEEFLQGWFHGVPYESIRRGNVEDFVAYGFYCRTMDTLPPRVCNHCNMCDRAC